MTSAFRKLGLVSRMLDQYTWWSPGDYNQNRAMRSYYGQLKDKYLKLAIGDWSATRAMGSPPEGEGLEQRGSAQTGLPTEPNRPPTPTRGVNSDMLVGPDECTCWVMNGDHPFCPYHNPE